MADILDEFDLKISRLRSFSENCRLDIAVPYAIGITRAIEILYTDDEISRKDYDKMKRDIEEAVSRSHRCLCIHPMSIFA